VSGAAARPGLFALLGWPVEHSLSPAIHAAAFRELGWEATYVALAVREEELDGVLPAVARAGGGNVTVPHKRAVAGRLDRPTDRVLRTGACNCFWTEGDELAGDNTDVGGFRSAVEAWSEARLGGRVLLLGAGGAARAVGEACREAGVERLEVWNRTTERARGLARGLRDRHGTQGPEVRVLASRGEAEGTFELVVNATSLGLDPDGDPLPIDLTRVSARAAFDLPNTTWTAQLARFREHVASTDGTLEALGAS
jgi:shikimate dehydrogenase